MEFYVFCVCCGLWFAVICIIAGFCLGGIYYNDLCNDSSRTNCNNTEPDRNNRSLDECIETEGEK